MIAGRNKFYINLGIHATEKEFLQAFVQLNIQIRESLKQQD